ncbi:hypothetical protein U9M48_037549 [Paspalum notatum var. saurae]|uniref:Uncharacterized protein n=1 Tax=Paspalum notatum var. saurae TaxID=547442 RepID=A0AAQ3UJY8_PASNO
MERRCGGRRGASLGERWEAEARCEGGPWVLGELCSVPSCRREASSRPRFKGIQIHFPRGHLVDIVAACSSQAVMAEQAEKIESNILLSEAWVISVDSYSIVPYKKPVWFFSDCSLF